jgi:hypothetical protein
LATSAASTAVSRIEAASRLSSNPVCRERYISLVSLVPDAGAIDAESRRSVKRFDYLTNRTRSACPVQVMIADV